MFSNLSWECSGVFANFLKCSASKNNSKFGKIFKTLFSNCPKQVQSCFTEVGIRHIFEAWDKILFAQIDFSFLVHGYTENSFIGGIFKPEYSI